MSRASIFYAELRPSIQVTFGALLFLVVVLSTTSSWTEQDRIATVSCSSSPDQTLKVETELKGGGFRARLDGYLNIWGFRLGSMVQLQPGSIAGTASYTLDARLMTSPIIDERLTLLSSPVRRGLVTHVDRDIELDAQRSGIDIQSTLLSYTDLWIENPKIRFIHDVSGLVNSDQKAIDLLRRSGNTRWAIIRGTVDSQNVDLYKPHFDFHGYNTLVIVHSYLHIAYSCSAVDSLEQRTNNSGEMVPMVVYFTPIKYDEKTSQIAVDDRPIESTQGGAGGIAAND